MMTALLITVAGPKISYHREELPRYVAIALYAPKVLLLAQYDRRVLNTQCLKLRGCRDNDFDGVLS
jgi:hypothetical protein